MSEYIISCCSTADLSKEHFTNRNIHYICFHYFLDGKPYADDLGQSMPFDKFYEAMANGADTKTSQINMEEFVEYFEPFLQEGKDIIHLTLSSGISGVYNSAMLAKEELAEKYPQYMFEKHKGYGTKLHYEMLDKYGASDIHRKSFLVKYFKAKNAGK